MNHPPKVAFIGAGSTIFLRHIVGDMMHCEALREAHVALMDVDAARLAESEEAARALVRAMGAGARVTAHKGRAAALDGADFVVVAFQIGGYRPATVTDFDVASRHGLRQTIADTLGVGGIMRGLRTVPVLWEVAADMERLCPDALMLQYVNPMAINTWALAERFPSLRQVGLCHSVQGTAADLARDLGLGPEQIRHRCGGINHMAFYLELEGPQGDLYPALREGYRAGRLGHATRANPRCPDLVRYEVMDQLGYFVTESSEHFAEYVPWFIKPHRPDLIERFRIPLDEYPRRCEEQVAEWRAHSARLDALPPPGRSDEYAATIMEAVVTNRPAVIHGNLPNHGLIPNLPAGCAVEVPCLVDGSGVRPTPVRGIPPHLTALMQTNVNVQRLTVEALLTENPEHVRHAAMLDPRAAAELDLRQIRALVDDLCAAHGDWLPAWARMPRAA
jgi:alpha-galactosidase